MKDNNNVNRILISVLISVVSTITIICVVGFVAYKFLPLGETLKEKVVYTSKKEVTVNENGISDAVDKIYNSTVIVSVATSSSSSGFGSGFIYKIDNKNAYLLTNHHVVDDAKTISVITTNGEETSATLVGSDEYADVAVLSIPYKEGMEPVTIGSSDDVKLGDTIFTIGTPIDLKYAFTVTRGILSGKDRMVSMKSQSKNSSYNFYWPYGNTYEAPAVTTETWYMNLMQVDASVNNGNSGGPLANSNGEVIGIINSKLSSGLSVSTSSATIENMGFAIPIADAMAVAKQLETDGKVTRPVLGVSFTTIANASRNGIEIPSSVKYGAVIVGVNKGSSAAAAGLESGDVIIAIDDKKVNDYVYFKYYLYRYKVGDKFTITYLRNGKEKKANVTLKN